MVLSIFAAVFAVLILSILLSSLFTVQSGDAAVIQRFGKFHRTAAAGLGIKLPFVETKMTLSLRVQQADLSMESKTRDNVFVSIPVSIQYAVDPGASTKRSTRCRARARRWKPSSTTSCSATFPAWSLMRYRARSRRSRCGSRRSWRRR